MTGGPSLTLVIPVFRGAAFLGDTLQKAWDWLGRLDRATELMVVDDGSDDATPQVVAAFAARCAPSRDHAFTAVRNERNRGKGWSVRRAFVLARCDLVVFTDADLTYPLDNVNALLKMLEQGADVAYGSRMHAGSRYIVAPGFFGKLFTRHFMGRMFNLLVRLFVVRGVYDTQAGLKGCRKAAAERLAGRIQLSRFSFDVELFAAAIRLGMRLADCPVMFVYRKEPSTVRFVRDSLAMLRDMAKVRWRSWRGVYDREPAPAVIQELRDGGAAPGAETLAFATPVQRPGKVRQSG